MPTKIPADQQTQPTIQPKDGDVFRFTYSAEAWERAQNRIGHGDLRWCFDGQLVFRGGRFYDSYWGLDRGVVDGRSLTVGEAVSDGTLAFVCNLGEVERLRGGQSEYELYADGDAFDLSYNHGCHKHYVKRIGAKKNPEKMRAAVHRRVQDARDAIDRGLRNLENAVQRREELLSRIEAGEEPRIY